MSTGKISDPPVSDNLSNPALLLQELIDSVPAHIFLKDRENRFLLVNRSFAEATGRSLEEMLRSGQRAAELTSQLLSYSRQQMLSPRELEVGGLLREMEPRLRGICGPGVALTVNSGSHVVRVDQEGFRQMMIHLLTYACEEMERVGSVQIAVFEAVLGPGEAPPEVGLAAGSYLVLTLRDTGPWMDEESLSQVFEPFRRPLESGGGLELSSVYGFVKQSGGYIWVESERGVGNRFTACFPKLGR